MARRPISMRKAREILRLKHELGLTNRQIGASLHMSHVSVGKYLQRAGEAGLVWPLAPEINDGDLRDLLRAAQRPPEAAGRALPAMAQVHRELHRPGVTLQLLWEEYRREQPGGYAYTQFCEYYKRFRGQLEPSLRQTYQAGEKLFVDWAGQTITVWDAATGQSREVHLFVGVLGASDYIFAEAFENHQLPSWLEAHVHAWEFYGGVATITVPDNEKTGVTHACRYEPELNRTYEELAAHYGTVVIPARAGEPQDKAKVENAVLNAERRILAVLRDRKFFSLGELNQAIRQALHDLNERPFQKLPGCRRELFEQLDKPALRPLPAGRYELARWQKATVNIDYPPSADHRPGVAYVPVGCAAAPATAARAFPQHQSALRSQVNRVEVPSAAHPTSRWCGHTTGLGGTRSSASTARSRSEAPRGPPATTELEPAGAASLLSGLPVHCA